MVGRKARAIISGQPDIAALIGRNPIDGQPGRGRRVPRGIDVLHAGLGAELPGEHL